MQFDRIVHFHKTMGDKTRVRIISLLKRGPLHGGAIAGKLGLKPPTISHHLAKLKEIDIIHQQRHKNTIYFSLNEKNLDRMARAITEIGGDGMFDITEAEKTQVLNNFLDSAGKLKSFPAQRKKKLIVLEYMLRGLEHGKVYPEKVINEHILHFYDDFATVRREWIMTHFMYRKDNLYELNPPEMWPV
ncbi:transcriptional regulator [Geomicrobium sp. JCM 19037]|uniref:DUF2087 domain-containing protein n=1 Tax=unclassified Geomicrobium TaxID=2628951 RepID=UPI00045F1DB1|nr:metalloregulator ArsR/SmtB family transcription factor [Geomicrobium sp. JCM 19037]GAK04020.1 transcriptional regulator [Geomicrobium sp. JCM 19037]